MKRLLFLLLLCCTTSIFACGEVKPNPAVTKIVKNFAYDDFPAPPDIFAVIRIESTYKASAINHNEREHSVGYMQIQNGPLDPKQNIIEGISRLRENYKRFGSREVAIMAYNIGPENYKNKIHLISGQEYYDKFALQRIVYKNYHKTGNLQKLGKTLGCGKHDVLPTSPTAKRRSAKSQVKVAAK